MPRLSRIDVPGVLQHIIVRGIERSDIFIDDGDRWDFIHRLAKLLPETATDCLAWALLTNHFHLLLRPRQQPLSTFMRRLLTGYAVYFNRRHNRSGHLFQNRYKSIVCEKETYLLELVRYIHLNPLRAGMIKNLKELDTCTWSGHSTLVGKAENHWQECDEVLSLFEYNPINYKSFISAGIKSGCEPKQEIGGNEKLKNCGPVLGSSQFKEKFINTKGMRRKHSNTTDVFSIILEKTLQHYKVKEEFFKSCSKSSAVSDCRAMVAYIAKEKLEMSGVAIAENIGLTKSAVSRLVQRGRKIAAREKNLIEKLDL